MKKIADYIEKIQSIFSMVLFVVFLLCIVIQVLTRYVPFVKIMWTEEIAIYSFIWAVLMGASIMVYRNGHFAFDVLRTKLKGAKVLVLDTIIYVLLIGFSAYMTYGGILLTKKFSGWKLTSLPNISQGFTWSALVVSGFTMCFYAITNLVEAYKSYNKGEEN